MTDKTDMVEEALAMIPASDVELMKHDGDTVRASWNYSADNIRINTAHMKPEETEALISLFRWCIDPKHPVHINEAAAKIGCSSQLIYQLMTGKYRKPDPKGIIKVRQADGTFKFFSPAGPSPDFLKNLREFLVLEAKRFTLGKTEFVMTPTARKIITALDLARESQSIVFIYGPSHVGKTWTAELHYTPANNHGKTIYCRMKAASGLGGMVRAMAKAAGISDKGNTADLIQRLKNASSPNTLWILDEVHLLANTYRKGSFFACMEVIREIFDETECGMALIFTILDDVKAASQRELQQLWRRGVHKVPLPLMPTKGDIGAILRHAGLDGEPVMSEGRRKEQIGIFPPKDLKVSVQNVIEQPYEILRQQAKLNGLKAITERLRYARKLATKENARGVTWEHFVDAHLRIEKQAQQEGEWF